MTAVELSPDMFFHLQARVNEYSSYLQQRADLAYTDCQDILALLHQAENSMQLSALPAPSPSKALTRPRKVIPPEVSLYHIVNANLKTDKVEFTFTHASVLKLYIM